MVIIITYEVCIKNSGAGEHAPSEHEYWLAQSCVPCKYSFSVMVAMTTWENDVYRSINVLNTNKNTDFYTPMR